MNYSLAHVSDSAGSTLKAAAVPTTKRVTPSAPATESAALHAALVICWQSASGATSRSTPRALAGLAAGQICRPSEAGTARAAPVLQVSGDDEADAAAVLPATHVAQAPEHAAVARPARSPKVPAGHSTHFCACRADEKVPGEHGVQGSKPENEKLPGPQPTIPVGVGAADTDALIDTEALVVSEGGGEEAEEDVGLADALVLEDGDGNGEIVGEAVGLVVGETAVPLVSKSTSEAESARL